jgi:predicted amidohydrolase
MAIKIFFTGLAALVLSVSVAKGSGMNSCQRVHSLKSADIEGALAKSLKVAAIQYDLAEGISPQVFFQKVEKFIAETAQQGAEVVVFPELITTEMVDYQSAISEKDQLRTLAQEVTPQYFQFIKDQAKKYKVSIMGGTSPRVSGKDIFNTAILALPDGRAFYQDKIFLTPDEKNWGWQAGKKINLIDAPWGRSVILICFDSEFPGISNRLVKHAPEVLFVPSWTSTEAGFNRVDWSTKARAIEHFAFVVKTATVPHVRSTQPHFGNASIVGPQEPFFNINPLEGSKNEVKIVWGTLDLKAMRERRILTGYFPGKEQTERNASIRMNGHLR